MAVATAELTAVPSVTYPAGRSRLLGIMTVITAVGFFMVLAMALFFAGTDITQGNVQRLFYLHVGSFFGGAVCFLTTGIAGIQYLRTRDHKWDRLALASVEAGLPLMTITLATGVFWSRPIWNTWWAGGDPRLNSMAVMWMLYAAYLALRAAVEDPDRRARFAAVYGVLAFVSVFYTFIVIRIRTDTLHPVVIGPSPVEAVAKGAFEVRADPRIGMTFGIAVLWWMLAAVTLLWHRVRQENLAEQVRALKARVMGS